MPRIYQVAEMSLRAFDKRGSGEMIDRGSSTAQVRSCMDFARGDRFRRRIRRLSSWKFFVDPLLYVSLHRLTPFIRL